MRQNRTRVVFASTFSDQFAGLRYILNVSLLTNTHTHSHVHSYIHRRMQTYIHFMYVYTPTVGQIDYQTPYTLNGTCRLFTLIQFFICYQLIY